MNLETFFDKFELFANAPDAVGKMRELVLALAVKGQLVPQDPNDELSLVESTKQRMGLFDLPNSWKWIQLGDTDPEFQNGASSRGDKDGVPVVVIRLADIKGRRITLNEPRAIPLLRNQIEKYRLQLGDTLITRVNGSSDIVGRFVPVDEDMTAIYCDHFIRMRIDRSSLFPGYTALLGDTRLVRDQIENLFVTTAGQKTINQSHIRSLIVPLPPLAEQKRIVAKVDELMALCDRLEAQQQERETRHAALARASLARFAEAPTPANLEFLFHNACAIPPADLRKSILTLAVQGKLVPQDPNEESARACFKRLGLNVAALSDGDDDSLPSSWCRVRFEGVAQTTGGVTLGRKLAEQETVTLPYLRVANVKRGEIDLALVKEVTIGASEIERYALHSNDLLMTEGGDWDKVGRAVIWRGQIPVCLHQNHVFRSRMRSEEISPLWFERYFNSAEGRRYFESAAKQTTNLASINMRQVRACPVPFPPLAEQRRIVAKVDELMTLVDKLEAQLVSARTTATNLLAAVVAELTNSKEPLSA